MEFYEVDKLRVYAQHIHLHYPNWKQDDDPLLPVGSPMVAFLSIVGNG